MASLAEEIRRQLEESARVKQSFSPELIERLGQYAEKCASALRRGGKIVFFGNGGSAADAVHLSAELVVRLRSERPGLAALALTANPSVLTAAGNDYGFEKIFSRQIESLVSHEDVVTALSTSGNSPNVVRGLEAGRVRGAYLTAFTGETGGAIAGKVDLLLNVPSRDPQRIQEAHITMGHIACALIERLVSA
ncbi:MAG TPA: SIS domain-containing protein [Candidatus Methylomirabilis sp.]|nr:SIS domain-containing protein [Candidatus Methylomirabilis sp.]